MFAEVIIDIAHANVDRLFTYRIPEGMDVSVGSHVTVPFGHGNRPKEGFVLSVCESYASEFPVKDILRVLEPYTVLLPEQIELAEWIRDSYHCLLVDALRLMIPAQLRGGRIHEKTEKTVSLSPGLSLKEMLDSLLTKSGKSRAPKQTLILELFGSGRESIHISEIRAKIPGSGASLTALLKRGYLIENGSVSYRRPSCRMEGADHEVFLNGAQRKAVGDVCGSVVNGEFCVYLLHGVTGSGKTEVYMRCIEKCIIGGRNAVMLVPEIALTPQTVARFRARFGDSIAVLHSRLTAGERFDEWRRIRLGRAKVAVGARSAVFAPFSNIGLFVIDEEHEMSYQSESAPRYHATEIAQHRASSFGAPVLLGSATPSLISYFRAKSGRYRLLELPGRVMDLPMPEVAIVDMREEFLRGNNGIFSEKLVSELDECLKNGHQAMLFLNRRGYSTFVSCRACGNVIQCPNCDISMTYHKRENRLRCHFCGASQAVPERCPACGKPFIKYFGTGTEQVEEQLHAFFPDVTSLRMDADTMRRKNAYDETLSAFSSGKAQVLIGTQMIAKGHDFPNVTLAGVVAADASLCFPDYRSTERTFQLLAQISGRAGRDKSPGRVVIQTYSPGHPAIVYAKHHDYKSFFSYEIAERRKCLFPPYSLFIRLLFSDSNEEQLNAAGEQYGRKLEQVLKNHLGKEGQQDLLMLSCSPAPIRKKQGLYRYQILIKLLRTKRTSETLHLIYDYEQEHRGELFPYLEVNPQDML